MNAPSGQQGPSGQHMGQMDQMQQYPVQPSGQGQMPQSSRTASWGQQPLSSPQGHQGPPHGLPQGPAMGQQSQGPPLGYNSFSHRSGSPAAPPTSLGGGEAQRPPSNQHNRSVSHNPIPSQPRPAPQPQFSSRNSAGTAPQYDSPPMAAQGPPQLGALPFQPREQQQESYRSTGAPGQERRGSAPNNPLQQHPPEQAPGEKPGLGGPTYGKTSPPLGQNPGQLQPMFNSGATGPTPPSKVPGKMFHQPLVALYERDNAAVPLIVTQCIQAVELYGLNMEGIYRQSGSLNHIHNLKAMFDRGKPCPLVFAKTVSNHVYNRPVQLCPRLQKPRAFLPRHQQRCRSPQDFLPRSSGSSAHKGTVSRVHCRSE